MITAVSILNAINGTGNRIVFIDFFIYPLYHLMSFKIMLNNLNIKFMETWKYVLYGYCGVAIVLCLLSLRKVIKIQKKTPENERLALIFKVLRSFIVSFLALTAVKVLTIAYMAGNMSTGLPALTVIALMLAGSCLLSRNKQLEVKSQYITDFYQRITD